MSTPPPRRLDITIVDGVLLSVHGHDRPDGSDAPIQLFGSINERPERRTVIDWWLGDEHGELAGSISDALGDDVDGTQAEAVLHALRQVMPKRGDDA